MNPGEKRIVFISYPRLTKVIAQLVPSYLKEVIVYEANIEEVLDISRKLIYENAVDVIISGGGNGQCLKEHIKEIPVIVFKITVANLLEGLKGLNKQASKIGILGYQNAIPDIWAYRDLIACNYVQEWYSNQEQMEAIFKRMIKSGCDGFIGTGVVCDYATDSGFPAYMVYSRENVENTFREAFNYEGSILFNKEREERTNIILNHSKRAFLFIGPDRKIQTANSSAVKILGIPGDKLVGSNLEELVNLNEFDAIVNSNAEVTESMIKMVGKELVVTWRPIRIENQIKEVIAFFDDSDPLEIGFRKNRKELLQSGFVASYSFRNIVGHSKLLQDAIELARDYADNTLTVLIRGETGTGKELFAQSIHNQSFRSSRPFVSVNCSALPKTLLESELFGYESGTFTGGRKEGKPGLIEQANSGTLFLDEIGDMSLEGQVMLLRVLQEKKVRRLGGNRIIPVDVRVIAATNQPLESLVHKESFRADLYYRLNVLSLQIPPLRSRRGDIPDLVEHFIAEHRINCHSDTLEALKSAFQQVDYHWPGNIRELENVLLRVTSAKCRTPREINTLLVGLLDTAALYPENARIAMEPEPLPSRQSVPRGERAQILAVLEQVHWNKTKAAQLLGMSRTTFWRKLSELRIN